MLAGRPRPPVRRGGACARFSRSRASRRSSPLSLLPLTSLLALSHPHLNSDTRPHSNMPVRLLCLFLSRPAHELTLLSPLLPPGSRHLAFSSSSHLRQQEKNAHVRPAPCPLGATRAARAASSHGLLQRVGGRRPGRRADALPSPPLSSHACLQNVYHGYDGLAKNPQSSPQMKAVRRARSPARRRGSRPASSTSSG